MSLASDFVNACSVGLVPGAEQIVYTPLATGTPKTIWAVVDRAPPKKDSEAFSVSTLNTVQVTVANDATLGITSVDTGGDMVTLSLKLGDVARNVKVRWPEMMDAGVFQLRCG